MGPVTGEHFPNPPPPLLQATAVTPPPPGASQFSPSLGCCLFLMGSGWLLLFPDGLWMVAVYSWWVVDGCCLFLMGSGWLLLFPDGLWLVVVYS